MREKDISQKQFFEDDIRFADLMNAVCFHGRQILKPEELEESTISVLKADEQAVVERFCDVVKKQTKDGAVYAIYVLENQETVDYGMLVELLDRESKFFLATMLGEKKLKKELLKNKQKEQEERSMCKAIDDLIEDGVQRGLRQGRIESEELIKELRKELTEVKEMSNCKAIDDLIEDGVKRGLRQGRAESEELIMELRKELFEVKKEIMMLKQEKEQCSKKLAEIG